MPDPNLTFQQKNEIQQATEILLHAPPEIVEQAYRMVFELGSFKKAARAMHVTETGLKRLWRDPRYVEMRSEVSRDEWVARVPDSTFLTTQLMGYIRDAFDEESPGDGAPQFAITVRDAAYCLDIMVRATEFWMGLANKEQPLGRIAALDPEQLAQQHERLAAMRRELGSRTKEITHDATVGADGSAASVGLAPGRETEGREADLPRLHHPGGAGGPLRGRPDGLPRDVDL